jgi:hypothetical protein
VIPATLPDISESLQLVTTIDPGMPIRDRPRRLFVNSDSRQLSQRHGEQPFLPRDVHEHLVQADFFRQANAACTSLPAAERAQVNTAG